MHFFASLVFQKLTYPFENRRFAINPNPAEKTRIGIQMKFYNRLNIPNESLDYQLNYYLEYFLTALVLYPKILYD